MFEPTRDDRIVQRGINEALACRDMLAAAPARPSPLAGLVALLAAARRQFGQLGRIRTSAMAPTPHIGTRPHEAPR